MDTLISETTKKCHAQYGGTHIIRNYRKQNGETYCTTEIICLKCQRNMNNIDYNRISCQSPKAGQSPSSCQSPRVCQSPRYKIHLISPSRNSQTRRNSFNFTSKLDRSPSKLDISSNGLGRSPSRLDRSTRRLDRSDNELNRSPRRNSSGSPSGSSSENSPTHSGMCSTTLDDPDSNSSGCENKINSPRSRQFHSRKFCNKPLRDTKYKVNPESRSLASERTSPSDVNIKFSRCGFSMAPKVNQRIGSEIFSFGK